MNKNVLVLSSSARQGSNSDTLCDEFMRGAEDAGHTVVKIMLKEQKIAPCTGCAACRQQNKCIHGDDMDVILDKMDDADVIVLATPVYFYTMSGLLKMTLDRTYGRYSGFKDKDFYFIMTSGAQKIIPSPNEGANSSAENAIGDSTFASLRAYVRHVTRKQEKGYIHGCGHAAGSVKETSAMTEAYEKGRAV